MTQTRTATKDDPDGPRKAAVLMVLLGEETSSRIMQHFDESEIVAIGREVAGLGEIPPPLASSVLEEYRRRIMSHRDAGEGGIAAARRMLSKTLAPDKAAALDEILGSAGDRGRGRDGAPEGAVQGLFGSLVGVKDVELAQALELEHPQTAALVLLHLEPARAAAVLAAMNEETQAGITARLARLSAVSPEVTKEVSDALAARFESARIAGVEEADGIGSAAEVLKMMDRSKSRSILSRLEAVDAEYAEKLRSRVYTFEMLLLLNDRGIQEILKGVDSKQLGLALKGATPEVGEKFFKNMSTRAAEMVKDEMEFLGAAKVRDVEQAQKDILDKALKLEEEGVIAFEAPEGVAS